MGQREAFLLSRGPFYSLYSRAELIKKKKKKSKRPEQDSFRETRETFLSTTSFDSRVSIIYPQKFRLLIEQDNVKSHA